MIDLDALVHNGMAEDPWRWALVPRTFAGPVEELVRTFPVDGFSFSSRDGDDKAYAMSSRPAIVAGVRSPGRLPAAWATFLHQVGGAAYRDALQTLTGVDLSDAVLDVTFWSYGPGCWLSAHPDKEDKLVSQVFYMNERWDPGWGGWLGILRSAQDEQPVHRVVPVAGTSVVIVRSDRSWHMVAPVRGVPEVRRSVQIVFRRSTPAGSTASPQGSEDEHA